MNVKEIVAERLRQKGYDGLYNPDIECGCLLADLMPCNSEGIETCEPGMRRAPRADLGEGPEADFVVAEGEPKAPKIVCLCGSTRFWREFQQASLRETLAGNIVLSIGAASGTDDEHFGNLPKADYDALKARLDELHLRKIDLADEVLILNVGGYIGESTGRELAYARKQGKAVRFLDECYPNGNYIPGPLDKCCVDIRPLLEADGPLPPSAPSAPSAGKGPGP